MKRIASFVVLATIAAGPLSATHADAFFIGTSARSTTRAEQPNTVGRPADQLRFGSKAWIEQMEREGRLGRRG